MSPRSILKRTATPPNQRACLAVHFPPTPSLTTHTFSVYSANVYDRSPIVVAPNSCAMPERGCPGRTYTLDDELGSSSTPQSSEIHPRDSRERHPRAFSQPRDISRPHKRSYAPLPALIPDLSSESDESDSFLNTPLETSLVHHFHGLAIPQEKYQMVEGEHHPYGPFATAALSFLPHPAFPPSRTHVHEPSSYEECYMVKPRPRRERRNDSSRSPDRISSRAEDVSAVVTPAKSRRTDITPPFQSSFNGDEDGCLGGF